MNIGASAPISQVFPSILGKFSGVLAYFPVFLGDLVGIYSNNKGLCPLFTCKLPANLCISGEFPCYIRGSAPYIEIISSEK